MKSSSLADSVIRVLTCQPNLAGCNRAAASWDPPNELSELLSGEEDTFGMVTSANKCEHGENLKHSEHGSAQNRLQGCFNPQFLSKLLFVFRWYTLDTYTTLFFCNNDCNKASEMKYSTLLTQIYEKLWLLKSPHQD